MSHKCPVCEQKIDTEHYAFVMETVKDPVKIKAWMDKEWTFEKWKAINNA